MKFYCSSVPWSEGNVESLCTSAATIHCNLFQAADILVDGFVTDVVLNNSIFILLINVFQVHVEFTDKEDRIKIEGPPEEVEKAQSDLENMATDLISKLTFVEMIVDPKFYKHIIGKGGANVNRLKDERGVVINIAENDGNNVIRIEGNKAGVERAKQVLQCL